jgi:hypothetical protein
MLPYPTRIISLTIFILCTGNDHVLETSIVDGSIVQLTGRQPFLLNPTGGCCCIVTMVIELDHGVIRLPYRSNC